MADSGKTITRLLGRWREGDEGAFDELLPLVYEDLHRLAARHRNRADATLRPTALVHEAYLRFQRHGGSFEDRSHFFAAAAVTMRRLLVDYARRRGRQKRGGDVVQVEFDEELVGAAEPATELLALDRALTELAAVDDRKVRIVELHFFGGMSYEETAGVLGVSPATIGRELRFAKAWLRKELSVEARA